MFEHFSTFFSFQGLKKCRQGFTINPNIYFFVLFRFVLDSSFILLVLISGLTLSASTHF